VFWQQAKLYNETLSPKNNSQLIICEGCSHTFAYDDNYIQVASELSKFYATINVV
jgi:hypothetical protein